MQNASDGIKSFKINFIRQNICFARNILMYNENFNIIKNNILYNFSFLKEHMFLSVTKKKNHRGLC